MARRRLTQLFPFLTPLRRWQRKCFFYLAMRLDSHRYASSIAPPLAHCQFSSDSQLINPHTGADIQYQYNKVHNLKLAAATMDGLLIRPGETFSFFQRVRHAQSGGQKYLDGLSVVNGELVGVPGGGLCQLSNHLFWTFLHSPLTVLERHGHAIQDFPPASEDELHGVDATVSEGWKDLKVENLTSHTYQLRIGFTEDHLHIDLLSDSPPEYRYEVTQQNLSYAWEEDCIYETCDIYRAKYPVSGDLPLFRTLLYRNKTRIAYPLPEGTEIKGVHA